MSGHLVRLSLTFGGDTSTLPRRFGKKIRAVGGTFTQMRGYEAMRCITFYLDRTGDASIDLALALVASYERCERFTVEPWRHGGQPTRLRPKVSPAELRLGIESAIAAEEAARIQLERANACKALAQAFEWHIAPAIRATLAARESTPTLEEARQVAEAVLVAAKVPA